MTFPDDLRYTNDHEWIRLGDDGLATIGVTDYAQSAMIFSSGSVRTCSRASYLSSR